MAQAKRVHTFSGIVQSCTQKAFKVWCEGVDDPFWIPFSQLEDPNEEYIRSTTGVEIEMTIPYWLAQEKDLV